MLLTVEGTVVCTVTFHTEWSVVLDIKWIGVMYV